MNSSATKNGCKEISEFFLHAHSHFIFVRQFFIPRIAMIPEDLESLQNFLHSARREIVLLTDLFVPKSSSSNPADPTAGKYSKLYKPLEITTVESRCPNFVAGAGSVRSSREHKKRHRCDRTVFLRVILSEVFPFPRQASAYSHGRRNTPKMPTLRSGLRENGKCCRLEQKQSLFSLSRK